MKKRFLVLGLFLCSAFLCACGKSDSNENVTNDSTIEEAKEVDSEEVENTEGEKEEEISIASLAGYRFEFCSGAGAWSTDMKVEKDGFFHGQYHDSDMGDSGDEYPDGTLYMSNFSGHFEDFKKVSEYKYEMRLKDISYKETPGTDEIADNMHYVYTEAYGLQNTEEFEVYFPGTPLSEFDEEVLSWIAMANENEKELTMCIIVNKDQRCSFYSYKRDSASEEAQEMYSYAKSSDEYLLEELQNLSTTMDMLANAESRYKSADYYLNELWILIKYNTDETRYNTILEEQREWLKTVEESAQAAYDSWEGGSFAPVDYADTKATMTLERCKVLCDYLQ